MDREAIDIDGNVNLFLAIYRIQSTGLGGLKPNTVIFGWPNGWRQSIEEDRSWRAFVDAIHTAAANKMALIVPKGISSFPDSTEKVRIVSNQPRLIRFTFHIGIQLHHQIENNRSIGNHFSVRADLRPYRRLVGRPRRWPPDVAALFAAPAPHLASLQDASLHCCSARGQFHSDEKRSQDVPRHFAY
jgi:hypothetical protein